MNTLIDIIFFADIIINIRTSYVIKETGEEVFNNRAIIMFYLKDRFIVDFFSAFPFEYVALIFFKDEHNTLWFQLLSVFKLIRLARLSGIITYLSLSNVNKTALRLLKLGLFVFIFVHCLA